MPLIIRSLECGSQLDEGVMVRSSKCVVCRGDAGRPLANTRAGAALLVFGQNNRDTYFFLAAHLAFCAPAILALPSSLSLLRFLAGSLGLRGAV